MNKEYVYLIAEDLYNKAAGHNLYNRNWLFAIYKSLLVANEGNNEEIIWRNEYKQWKIDHNCRAAKSQANRNRTILQKIRLSNITEDSANIEAEFNKGRVVIEQCIYRKDGFQSGLWRIPNPNGKTVLLSAFERDELFRATLPDCDEICEPEVDVPQTVVEIAAEQTVGEIGPEPQQNSSKFLALKCLLDQIRSVYGQSNDATQRSFIETVVGAAIFYLPTSINKHFTGYISVAAIKGFVNGQRRVKDHTTPRKFAARELLKSPLRLDELKSKYHDHLARYMYVTSTENSLLKNYYETYDNYDDALVAFQIEKFPLNYQREFSSHNELERFIRFLDGKNIQNKSKEELGELLDEFRN